MDHSTTKPDALAVRPCGDADWDDVLSLLRDVYAGERYVPPEHAKRSYTRERLSAGGLVLVARDASAVLGVVVLAYPGGPLSKIAGRGEAEFRMLAVAPMGRGKGIGGLLVNECIERAAAEPFSAERLVLWTQPSLIAAQRLYERLGFERVWERDAELPPLTDGSAPVQQLVYARALA